MGTTTKAETPFRLSDIVFLRTYTPEILNFQQCTYFCIITNKFFENGINYRDTNVHNEGLVVGQGSPDHRDYDVGAVDILLDCICPLRSSFILGHGHADI